MLAFFGDLSDDRSRVTSIGDGEMLSFQKAHNGRSSAEVIIDRVLLCPCPAGGTFHEFLRPIRILYISTLATASICLKSSGANVLHFAH